MSSQVLLAIENPLARKLLTALLEWEGYTVTPRDCPSRTLRTLQERPFNIVILEDSLAEADPRQFAVAVRQLVPDAIVVLFSDQCVAEADGIRCLSKSFDRVDLADVLRGSSVLEESA